MDPTEGDQVSLREPLVQEGSPMQGSCARRRANPPNKLQDTFGRSGTVNGQIVLLVIVLWPRPFFEAPQWARRDILMSRGKNRRETIFVSQLSRNYPHRGGDFERRTVIASQKLSRDSGETISAARHHDVSRGPLGPRCL